MTTEKIDFKVWYCPFTTGYAILLVERNLTNPTARRAYGALLIVEYPNKISNFQELRCNYDNIPAEMPNVPEVLSDDWIFEEQKNWADEMVAAYLEKTRSAGLPCGQRQWVESTLSAFSGLYFRASQIEPLKSIEKHLESPALKEFFRTVGVMFYRGAQIRTKALETE